MLPLASCPAGSAAASPPKPKTQTGWARGCDQRGAVSAGKHMYHTCNRVEVWHPPPAGPQQSFPQTRSRRGRPASGRGSPAHRDGSRQGAEEH